jgi:hypothetical protein
LARGRRRGGRDHDRDPRYAPFHAALSSERSGPSRLEGKACKAMARMDEIEGRNPGLVSHKLSARRAELAEKHDGLARRLG